MLPYGSSGFAVARATTSAQGNAPQKRLVGTKTAAPTQVAATAIPDNKPPSAPGMLAIAIAVIAKGATLTADLNREWHRSAFL